MFDLNLYGKEKYSLFAFVTLLLLVFTFFNSLFVWDINSKEKFATKKNLIDTPGCSIPELLVFNRPNFLIIKKKNSSPLKPTNCDFEKQIAKIDDKNEILYLTPEGKYEGNNKCTAVEIVHTSTLASPDSFTYGRKFDITDTLQIKNTELVATKCGKFTTFDAHFPINQQVQDKINYWKKISNTQPELPKPINVLFIGFDSISRSNFHRSLPKTIPLMIKMGFLDFKGFHSNTPSTLQNFFAFLMGLSNRDVRSNYVIDWTFSFDKCPFIWKDFDQNKFVTVYAEDGEQSFSSGGRIGFVNKPTDYYPHPLFKAITSYLKKQNSSQNLSDNHHHRACHSTSTLNLKAPNFLLQYTKTFLKKFKNTPFFSFAWFSHPFGENTQALYSMDDKLHDLFKFLESDKDGAKELRERTLIIFTSDHGEKSGNSFEHSADRVLPGLFIRLPEKLLERFPQQNLIEKMKINTQRLTSGFDIHHTLLHLLDLQGLKLTAFNNSTSSEFEPSFKPRMMDRSSLFLSVSDQRSCKHIPRYY